MTGEKAAKFYAAWWKNPPRKNKARSLHHIYMAYDYMTDYWLKTSSVKWCLLASTAHHSDCNQPQTVLLEKSREVFRREVFQREGFQKRRKTTDWRQNLTNHLHTFSQSLHNHLHTFSQSLHKSLHTLSQTLYKPFHKVSKSLYKPFTHPFTNPLQTLSQSIPKSLQNIHTHNSWSSQTIIS